jgi:uncharacterized protein (DUF4415 family)
MKKKDLRKPSQTDCACLEDRQDEDIDFSDIPELSNAFFQNAVLRLPKPKAKVCIRLGQDILEWFKSQDKGYQTKINAVLRAFKESQSA